VVTAITVQDWLDRLGYSAERAALHVRGETVPEAHPYALEINTLLKPDGGIRAQAVFDVEGVPTVVFVGDDDHPLSPQALDEARQRIWNQNLASIVIEVQGDRAVALPARRLPDAAQTLQLESARPDGPFSVRDVASANLARRTPDWFDVKARVDYQLLENLRTGVERLTRSGITGSSETARRRFAQLLMGQVLFVSYLEHRDIVGETYRALRQVGRLHQLVATQDRAGVRELIDRLRADFNGDFLGTDRHDPWASMTSDGFRLLDDFLARAELQTGQGDFWNYDFSYIPVELLSGLYESFLSPEQQAREGAYYTPRNLAMLVVDQALASSPNPLDETIFDGACGSGILLTTAYRRLIALAEARHGRQIGFAERGELLKAKIFGGDINLMACRVTAFSLYLSLLEGLDPADILEAQQRENVKLPPLAGVNLVHGVQAADFFRTSHTFEGRRFSLIVSNPPWAEPPGGDRTSADEWAERSGAPFVRRQIAGAYALRALDFLADDGRICLILPIGQLLGASSGGFVSRLLTIYRPLRLTNFGDLQGLLFPTAENTCHVFIGARRSGLTPFDEMFDYCVPKADMSLALGRLTMQSADRHRLQTMSVAQDPQLLVMMMWGDASDLAIWTRLSMRGAFSDFWTEPTRRWTNRKGIHRHDRHREAVSAAPLRRMRHVPIGALGAGVPVLHPDLLKPWPEPQATVVGLNDAVMAIFDGPRVLFPDGFSREDHSVRAVFYDGPASFTHSIGVIAGPREDALLLQFAAVYLRSSLARYFLMMRGWKMLCERNGVHLTDIESFAFFPPETAPDPEAAAAALQVAGAFMAEITSLDELAQAGFYEERRAGLDEAVFTYFGLRAEERVLVRETVEVFMPSIRPRSFRSLNTPAQRSATRGDFETYAHALGEALTRWRNRTAGRGRFQVKVVTSDPSCAGPSGIVRIVYAESPTGDPSVDTAIDDKIVAATLATLREAGLSIVGSGDGLTLVPDTELWVNGALYLVRPLARRSWTVRQALRDAERIVRAVQDRARPAQPTEAA
jgi:hypothetical protein